MQARSRTRAIVVLNLVATLLVGLEVAGYRYDLQFNLLEQAWRAHRASDALPAFVAVLVCVLAARALIVAPPGAGATTTLRAIGDALPSGCHRMLLLVDQRPEDVAAIRRDTTNGEVIASTVDMHPASHIELAALALELKDTANAWLRLRSDSTVDVSLSGTRRVDLLQSAEEQAAAARLRELLPTMDPDAALHASSVD